MESTNGPAMQAMQAMLPSSSAPGPPRRGWLLRRRAATLCLCFELVLFLTAPLVVFLIKHQGLGDSVHVHADSVHSQGLGGGVRDEHVNNDASVDLRNVCIRRAHPDDCDWNSSRPRSCNDTQPPHLWPTVVAWGGPNEFLCMATLVAKNMVLTTANCIRQIEGRSDFVDGLRVRSYAVAGRNMLQPPAVSCSPHPSTALVKCTARYATDGVEVEASTAATRYYESAVATVALRQDLNLALLFLTGDLPVDDSLCLVKGAGCAQIDVTASDFNNCRLSGYARDGSWYDMLPRGIVRDHDLTLVVNGTDHVCEVNEGSPLVCQNNEELWKLVGLSIGSCSSAAATRNLEDYVFLPVLSLYDLVDQVCNQTLSGSS